METINKEFLEYLEEAIGAEKASIAFSALEEPASVSVRQNPAKRAPVFEGSARVPWCPDGMFLESRPSFTLDPLFHAGSYYVQDSSSMFVGYIFRQVLKEYRKKKNGLLRVLDLCAAPGGKTTDIAASLRQVCGDGFLLVSNEVMKNRASVLADNVAIWGDPNVVVTSDDPSAFGPLQGYFDIIVADVPCSGEGMFRKDEEAVSQWSVDNVALCSARQKRIVADVWPSLADGGILVYSTCTFNRYENDGNSAWIADELGAEHVSVPEAGTYDEIIETDYGWSLVPGFVRGEGQYCAVLSKAGTPGMGVSFPKPKPKQDCRADLCRYFSMPVVPVMKGELVKAVPDPVIADVSFLTGKLHILSSGCAAGTVKGKDFVPDADMALSILLKDDAFPRVEADFKTALEFLHRDTVRFPEAPRGYLLVCYQGMPLGFVKNLGNRCNNLHPQDRRIRMDIKNSMI